MKFVDLFKKNFEKGGKVRVNKDNYKFEGDIKNQESHLINSELPHVIKNLEALTHFKFILNKIGLAVWSISLLENRINFASEKLSEIFEIPLNQITIDIWKRLLHPDDQYDINDMYSELTVKDKMRHSYRIITPTGKVKWLIETVIAIRDDEGKLNSLVGSVEDISQNIQLNDKVKYISTHDSLTELPNFYHGRAYLKELIEKSKAKRNRFALFCINIDDFNLITQNLGFKVADDIIKKLSKRLSETVQEQYFLFRSLGDEWFLVVKTSYRQVDYKKIASEILNKIQEVFHIKDFSIHLTASIGISVFPDDADNKIDLIKNAQTALKVAKNTDKSSFLMYSTSMNIETFKHFQLVNDLYGAIERKELYIEYQPKVDIKRLVVESAEALVRWKHPNWGEISPLEFISIAEQSSLHNEIADFVINTVCKDMREWNSKGIVFKKVSINLSAKDFVNSTLEDRIRNILKKYHISPSFLEIEITESTVLQKQKMVHNHINRLEKLGLSFSLDDFGTGYSSINHLKTLPVSTVKIDRSFVQNLPLNREDQIIVKSIIELSKGLNKTIVAEGVETIEQFEILKKYGCDTVQGYYFSKPISSKELIKWFQAKRVQPNDQSIPTFNRRKYYRINFELPLSTNMTILNFNGKKVNLGTTEIMVLDIGLGGIRFQSHLRLKPHENIIYGFKTILNGNEINLVGKIVRYEEIVENIFEYGVEFLISETERSNLAIILNKISLMIKANRFFNDGNFIDEAPITYLKRKYLKERNNF